MTQMEMSGNDAAKMADRISCSAGKTETEEGTDAYKPRGLHRHHYGVKNIFRETYTPIQGGVDINQDFSQTLKYTKCNCKAHTDESPKHENKSIDYTYPNLCRKKLSMFLLLRMMATFWRSNLARIFSCLVVILLTERSFGVMAQNYQYGGMLIQQKFAMEPQDQTAIVGSRVTLPCRVVGKSGVLQWTKDDFGLGAHRNLSGYDRYAMVGSDEEGDFSLDISPVLLEDDARYQCQVSPGPQGQAAIRSRFAVLSVLVPPDPPKILQGPRLTATEDQEIELECVSVGGKPAAEITWIDGEGNVMTQNLEYVTEILPDGRRVTAKSVLRLTPKRRHHNLTLTCQAQNTADRAYRAATVHLEVRHAPVVSLKVPLDSKTGGRAKEGIQLELACNVEANPTEVTYKWFLNDEPIPGNHSTKLVINNVTRELHNSIIRCEALNEVGRSEDSETLDVAYGPSFRSKPSDVESDLDAAVTLSCDVEGNPPPQIIWLHEDQDRWSVVGRTPNLTLTVDSSTSGKYLCKASVQGFPEIEAEATVYLRGPPAVVSRRAQTGAAGAPARVQCLAVAVPRPRVLWLLRGRPITPQDQDFSILEDVLPEGVRSTLIIRESQSKHFGSYNCSASNDYGTDVVEITLVAQRSFPLLVILSGVIGGAIVIVAMTMIFILCRKKKEKQNPAQRDNKKPDVMADTEKAGADKRSQNSDRNSCISDLKLDLKDADGNCEMDYRVGLPLSGPMLMPGNQNGLLLQYPRFSNEYIDPLFPPSSEYKDEHGYSGYTGYGDYNRDYSPAPPTLQPPLTAMGSHDATRVQLSSLHSSHQLTAHLNQLNAQLSSITNNGSSINSSLTRSTDTASTVPCTSASNSQNNSLQRANLEFKVQPNPVDATGMPIFRNGSAGMNYSGSDLRHVSLSNPHLRITAGLGTVNTANPAATPAPPPYSGHRATSTLSTGSHVSTPPGSLTPPTSLAGVPNGGPSNAQPQSPGSQYILPPTTQSNGQLVHLTKKGTGTQPALATHV